MEAMARVVARVVAVVRELAIVRLGTKVLFVVHLEEGMVAADQRRLASELQLRRGPARVTGRAKEVWWREAAAVG